ncbi:transposase, partial [Colwellia sp. MB02u-9]|uniref:IS110 family transposase n=1 Tax=Colwellia sp. MB02u-9 TaxID=2759823 RepID=UPI0015F51F25
SSTRKFEVIKHSPKSINEWISSLHKQYKGQIAVAIELSKGPIVYALQKFDFVTIHPVNTSMLAQYRKAFSPSGAKDDPTTDAELALDLMLGYPSIKSKALKMESESVRKLTYLVEQRRKLVDDKRRFSNRLIITLKEYYPHLLDWFSHRGSGIFCDFITRWPNLQKLKRARADTLKKFFASYPGRTAAYSVKRIQSISEAEPLTIDNAVIESHQLLAVALANQLLVAVKVIKVFDREISELFNALPDAELYNSLPGTGPCLAPRL